MADALNWAEVRQLVHEELNKLPQRYRDVLAACYLRGMTQDKAAKELALPKRTVKWRLERARELFRAALIRRGLGPTSLLVAATWPAAAVSESGVPASLAATTARASSCLASGQAIAGLVTFRVANLAAEMVKAMSLTKSKTVIAILTSIVLVCASAYALALHLWVDPRGGEQEGEQAKGAPAVRDELDDALPQGAVARLGTARLRHGGKVTSVAYLLDGKTIASGGGDGSIRIWDAATSREIRRLEGDHIAMSPDGKTWASWAMASHLHTAERSSDETIRIRDVATGKQLHAFKRGQQLRAYTVVFSPDGKVVAAAGAEDKQVNQISLWEVATGKELPAPKMGGKYDFVYRLAFSSDGKTIATSGDDDSKVRFRDLASGAELAPLEAARCWHIRPRGRNWRWAPRRTTSH
jgi:hypothetical protein